MNSDQGHGNDTEYGINCIADITIYCSHKINSILRISFSIEMKLRMFLTEIANLD